MLSNFSYPILCTDKYAQTVNFYEDYLGYVVTMESNGFVVMRREEFDNMYLAVIDLNHGAIPDEYRKSASGMILSYPVADVRTAYQNLYWEGLTLVNEPSETYCGRLHFMVVDPNGILVDVSENIPVEIPAPSELPTEQFAYIAEGL